MKNIKNIGLAMASAIAIVFTSGCATSQSSKTAPPVVYNTPAPTQVTNMANMQPATPTISSGGVAIQLVAVPPTPPATNGMAGGVSCLFVNKTEETITVFATSTKTGRTFTLEVPRNSYRVFPVLPEDWEYTYTVGEDPTSFGPFTLPVNKKAIHLYDGAVLAGNYHAVVIFKVNK